MIRFFDARGNCITRMPASSSWDVRAVPAGIYILKAETGKAMTMRVINVIR
jgi:hypothetical protein